MLYCLFLNNDVQHSAAKGGLFLKANGYEGWFCMMRVFNSFLVLPQIASLLSGERRNSAQRGWGWGWQRVKVKPVHLSMHRHNPLFLNTP